MWSENSHFCQKCPSLRQKKWHFWWQNQNSKTTFIVQTFPKYCRKGFYFMKLSLLSPILAKFPFCGFLGLFWAFFPCKKCKKLKCNSPYQKQSFRQLLSSVLRPIRSSMPRNDDEDAEEHDHEAVA